ncbi:peptidylprolyl isomerase [Bacteroidota bacterium]
MKGYSIKILIGLGFIFLMNNQLSNAQTSEKTNELIHLDTEFGSIIIWLYDQTPKHKANFLKLAKEGFYDGTTFHRIIDNFMIQGGDPNSKDNDPTNDGGGGPGYTIDAEIIPGINHTYGSVAAARMGDQVNPQRSSSGSQFYIVENKNGTPHLNGGYTVFGKVIAGMEVVEKIAIQPKDQRDRPIADIKMTVIVITMTTGELKEKYNFVVQ